MTKTIFHKSNFVMDRAARRFCLSFAAASVLSTSWVSLTQGQTADPAQPAAASAPDQLGEIMVNARKRQESILDVPVVEAALPRAELERMQTVEVDDLPSLVPGLQFGRSVVAIGTQASIRGVGTTALDQGVDQSVALNIDGMAPGSGLAFQSGLFDLQQVEVLKGPQALFYGKSSPGGVISLRTADPTDEFELIGRESYDFVAITPREEAIISGPVTDTLKLRLASMYQTSEGFFENKGVAVPDTGAVTPTDPRASRSENYIIRGTALWNPIAEFDARLKINYVHDYTVNPETAQYTDCPEGQGFAPAGINFLGNEPGSCHIGTNVYGVWLDPNAYAAGSIPNRGIPSNDTDQQYETLEMNYRPSNDVTITSVTADYRLLSEDLTNAYQTTGAGTPLAAVNHFHRRESTEELRANSEFATPINFTVGAFYESGMITQDVALPFNTALGLPAASLAMVDPIAIRTYSAFAQVRWQIFSQLELAAGNRYSDETRTENPVSPDGVGIPVLQPRVHADNNSPEVTLTYKPTSELTAFGSYKQGFKSGSFSIATPVSPDTNNSFGEETVRGGEIGLKSLLFERTLTANVAAYLYNYSGLQVGANVPTTTGGIDLQTVNAGAARVYGVDFDTAYRPPSVDGLGLNGAIDWNHARYQVLDNAPCWGGQTIAEGCNQIFDKTTGLYTSQNLSGTPLIRAPEWQIQLGFNYEYALSNGYKLGLNNNNAFSSRYVTFLAVGRPNNDNYQGSFFKSDVGVSITAPQGNWDIALIGKNLNNRITTGNCAAGNNAAGGLFAAQTTGGTTSGPDGIDQVACFTDPGREVWPRLTVRAFH